MIDDATFDRLTRNEFDIAFLRRARTIFDWLDLEGRPRILDCGAGRGFYLNMLAEVSRARLAGVELDPAILARARRNVQGLESVALVRGSLLALPFADAAFDAVILSEVLEHVEDDLEGLLEAARVVRPGGTIAITVPHAEYPFWWDPLNRTLEDLFGTHVRSGPLAGIWAHHVRLYTRAGLRGLVTDAGLQVVEERAFTHHCFPFVHNLLYGLGKPLLESGLLPDAAARAADRAAIRGPAAGRFNPMRWALALVRWPDRFNAANEPEGRSCVNLCLRARRPPR